MHFYSRDSVAGQITISHYGGNPRSQFWGRWARFWSFTAHFEYPGARFGQFSAIIGAQSLDLRYFLATFGVKGHLRPIMRV